MKDILNAISLVIFIGIMCCLALGGMYMSSRDEVRKKSDIIRTHTERLRFLSARRTWLLQTATHDPLLKGEGDEELKAAVTAFDETQMRALTLMHEGFNCGTWYVVPDDQDGVRDLYRQSLAIHLILKKLLGKSDTPINIARRDLLERIQENEQEIEREWKKLMNEARSSNENAENMLPDKNCAIRRRPTPAIPSPAPPGL